LSVPSGPDDLLARHRRVLPSWLRLFYQEPIEIVSGHGCRVVDGDGREYLDFFGGILTTISGHSVPEVVDAIRTQAGRMLHTSTLYLIRPMVELAERIAGLCGIPDAKVFFVNSGSEANETALMLCAAARRSNQVLAVRHSYHGRSFATVATTGIRSWSASSLSPLNVHYVHGGYRFRSPFRHGLFGAMQKVLDERGILFVSDEVQTGWGRTGRHFWGYEAHGVRPDLITFAKGVGNGLALGGVAGRAELVDSVSANSISTFGGNPLACAGALANLEFLLSHDLQGNARARGEQLLEGLAGAEGRFPVVGEVRGRGLMVAVELVRPGTREPNPDAAAVVLEAAKRRGLLVGQGGLAGNVIRIAPPLSVSPAEVDQALGVLGEALAEADSAG
jgi:4-aminobutyrate aminotransferase